LSNDPSALLAQAPSLLTNGSFESGYTGWSESGNQNIYTTSFAPTTDGVKGVQFNGAQATPNGVLSQTFSVTPNTVYTLRFDLGVTGWRTTAQQSMGVTVVGNSTLLSQVVSVFGIGTGTAFTAETLTFTTDSSNAVTLTFTDVSPATINIDMLLDNARVTSGSSSTPTPTPTTTPSGTSLITNAGDSI
jgi:hypothetical protein